MSRSDIALLSECQDGAAPRQPASGAGARPRPAAGRSRPRSGRRPRRACGGPSARRRRRSGRAGRRARRPGARRARGSRGRALAAPRPARASRSRGDRRARSGRRRARRSSRAWPGRTIFARAGELHSAGSAPASARARHVARNGRPQMRDDPLGRIGDRVRGGAEGAEDREQELLVGLERAGHTHEQPLGRQARSPPRRRAGCAGARGRPRRRPRVWVRRLPTPGSRPARARAGAVGPDRGRPSPSCARSREPRGTASCSRRGRR